LASAPLVHYAQTSRGYALQTLLIVLCAWSLHAATGGGHDELRYWQRGRYRRGAVLVLPTSVLFLTPIVVCDWVRRFRERRCEGADHETIFCAASTGAHCRCALGFVSGAWLLHGASQFAAGREQFGTPVTSIGQWFSFVGNACLELWGWPILILVIVAVLLAKDRGLQTYLAAVLLFPFWPPL